MELIKVVIYVLVFAVVYFPVRAIINRIIK